MWPGSQVENLPSKPSTWNSSSPANPPHIFLKIKVFFVDGMGVLDSGRQEQFSNTCQMWVLKDLRKRMEALSEIASSFKESVDPIMTPIFIRLNDSVLRHNNSR